MNSNTHHWIGNRCQPSGVVREESMSDFLSKAVPNHEARIDNHDTRIKLLEETVAQLSAAVAELRTVCGKYELELATLHDRIEEINEYAQHGGRRIYGRSAK